MKPKRNLKQRPLLRYHGGKWRVGAWIISHFPEHKIYCEPYGGAASVLLQKDKSFAEIYNDLDNHIVHLFRVLRDPELGPELIHQVRYTPFSRKEFDESYELNVLDPVEKARRIIIRSFLGFSSNSVTRDDKTGFRSKSFRSGEYSGGDWAQFPDAMPFMIKRLKVVCIECIDGLDCILKYDTDKTLHYVDPPYLLSTRHKGASRGEYRFEMHDWEHENLVRRLLNLQGKVVLSGYDNEMYNDYLIKWRTDTKETRAQSANGGSKKATEKIWMNF